MQQYGVRDVEKLLRLPRRTIRALTCAGFVTPARGPRNAWRFSFQDLIVLRAAQSLAQAQIPVRRIRRCLKQLREQLPASVPLSGLSITAVGEQVVVREGARQWQVDSGQYLLALETDQEGGSLTVIAPREPSVASAPCDWFERGMTLEKTNPDAAVDAYVQAIAEHPDRMDARINLGRLLHEIGKLQAAECVYRDAIAHCGPDPVVLYNLGVLLGDTQRLREAIEAYEAALRQDAALADCHFNMSLLYRKIDQPKAAIRHMAQYRRMTRR
jgi:tetratricopeptide (TPR) repeat protein